MVQDRSEAGGRAMASDPRLDFVFYDMERSYDFPALQTFIRGFRAADGSKTLLVRIAPIAGGREAAAERVAELLRAGADGIVFPGVRSREDAELGVELLRSGGRGVWPLDPGGVVGYFMIESREGLANAREILSVPGVGFGAPGQGSDAEAVEAAIQEILMGCEALGVVCAKLVDDTDAERRVRDGFRVIMGSGGALDAGRRAAGRPAPGGR
jgi:2-keto-3-deoxy-L-rhamnonate aldolase RhmA